MRKITITSRRSGIFDTCPVCEVFVDKCCFGKILPGQTVTYELEENYPHNICCCYNYGNDNMEISNTICINDAKEHHLILGVVFSKTYIGRFKENIQSLFTKGYINVPDIELYEEA